MENKVLEMVRRILEEKYKVKLEISFRKEEI